MSPHPVKGFSQTFSQFCDLLTSVEYKVKTEISEKPTVTWSHKYEQAVHVQSSRAPDPDGFSLRLVRKTLPSRNWVTDCHSW